MTRFCWNHNQSCMLQQKKVCPFFLPSQDYFVTTFFPNKKMLLEQKKLAWVTHFSPLLLQYHWLQQWLQKMWKDRRQQRDWHRIRNFLSNNVSHFCCPPCHNWILGDNPKVIKLQRGKLVLVAVTVCVVLKIRTWVLQAKASILEWLDSGVSEAIS